MKKKNLSRCIGFSQTAICLNIAGLFFSMATLAKVYSEKCEISPGAMIKEVKLSPECGGKKVRIGFEKKAGQDAFKVNICVPRLVVGYPSKEVYGAGQIQLLMLHASDHANRQVLVMENSTQVAKVNYPDDHSRIELRTLGQHETKISDTKDTTVCNIEIDFLGEKNRKVKVASESSKNIYTFSSSEIPASGTPVGAPAPVPPELSPAASSESTHGR